MLSDPVDRLIVDESHRQPHQTSSIAVVGSPELAAFAHRLGARVHAFCDSFTDHESLPSGINRVTPAVALPTLDLAWLRLPRSLDELDELAGWLARSGADLVAGGRTKHMTVSMNRVLQRHYGSVHASLGRDKSRVLHASQPLSDSHPRPTPSGWPRETTVPLPGVGPTQLWHHGGTFASGRLDAGTALLLDHLPAALGTLRPATGLDWGSGAGVISSWLLARYPELSMTAIDLSWAGASASEATLMRHADRAEVRWADANGWLAQASGLDLIVSNPPFHAGAAKDSTATTTMIDTAAAALSPHGVLVLVYNSHLPWLTHLRRHGEAEVVAQNRGYTVAKLRR